MPRVGLEPTTVSLSRVSEVKIQALSLFRAPTRARTWDRLLKRELLYQLSYGCTKKTNWHWLFVFFQRATLEAKQRELLYQPS